MVKSGIRPVLRGILVLSILMTVALYVSPHDVDAQQENLLRNGGFEQGWYDFATGQVPNGWEINWTTGETMGDANNKTLKPESNVKPRQLIPPDEHDLYIRDGDHTLKIFKEKAPIHFAISQDVTGLEPGRQYRFVVPAFVNLFNWEGEKVPPSDPYAAQVRLGAGPKGTGWQDDEGAISFSGWANASNTPSFYLDRSTLQFDFVATAPEMTVFVEFTSKWGIDNNGIWLDALRLEPLGMAQPPTSTPPPPPPTATPGPSPTPPATATPRPDGSTVHVVQSGDTLSSIALEYGVSVDDLLELNAESIGPDNLIRTDQELVVSVAPGAPTSTPLPEPATATPQPEASPSPTSEPEGASICVLAFHDRNGDTVRDPDSEELLPNVEFTLANAAGIVARYTSDGVNEPHCFSDLAAGSYRVVQEPPEGYEATGLPEQNVALAEGTSFDLPFGSARIAAEETPDESDAGEETSPAGEETAPADGDGLLGGALTTVARVAGILVLILAGAIAVLFFLGRRRRP